MLGRNRSINKQNKEYDSKYNHPKIIFTITFRRTIIKPTWYVDINNIYSIIDTSFHNISPIYIVIYLHIPRVGGLS